MLFRRRLGGNRHRGADVFASGRTRGRLRRARQAKAHGEDESHEQAEAEQHAEQPAETEILMVVHGGTRGAQAQARSAAASDAGSGPGGKAWVPRTSTLTRASGQKQARRQARHQTGCWPAASSAGRRRVITGSTGARERDSAREGRRRGVERPALSSSCSGCARSPAQVWAMPASAAAWEALSAKISQTTGRRAAFTTPVSQKHGGNLHPRRVDYCPEPVSRAR